MTVHLSLMLCLGWSFSIAAQSYLGNVKIGLISEKNGLFEQFGNKTNRPTTLAVVMTSPRKEQTNLNSNGRCSGVTCPGKTECQEERGRLRCTCKLHCSRDQRRVGPVCASDGRTYRSLCALHRFNCLAAHTVLEFRHAGSCAVKRRQETGKKGQTLLHKLERQGATFSQLLKGQSAASVHTKKHDGLNSRKQANATCQHLTCPGKQTCRERKGRAMCTCKLPCTPLTRGIGPVCGSDGRTYRSLCQLFRADCRAGQMDISYQQPASCEVDFKQFGNEPVILFSKNDLPADLPVPTPPPGWRAWLSRPQHTFNLT